MTTIEERKWEVFLREGKERKRERIKTIYVIMFGNLKVINKGKRMRNV